MADKKQRTAVFKGLNRMPYIGDGEMRNMRNLSSDAYPFITTRKGRKPYTFVTKIPSPEGEAYRDIERLPEPCAEEDGNIYKVTTDAIEPEYVSGNFYYYKNGAWVEGIKKRELHGVTNISDKYWLIQDTYVRNEVSAQRYPVYGSNSAYKFCEYYGKNLEDSPLLEKETEGTTTFYTYNGVMVKYTGNSEGTWDKGKTYIYKMYVTAYWIEGTWDSTSSVGNLTEVNPATITSAANKNWFKYAGETNGTFEKSKQYKCVVDSYCKWEECESQYDVVEVMPEAPGENQQVRFISKQYGAPMKKGYYRYESESLSGGEIVYFNAKCSLPIEEHKKVGFLSEADAENEGEVYLYQGVETAGTFAMCFFTNENYDWEIVAHPKVERIVTLADYLDNYDGSGLKEIVEIGNYRGALAALIIDGSGERKLYYNQKLWPVKNSSDESGKRLVPVGKYLVVGESGSYLHLKESNSEDGGKTSEIEFFEMPGRFNHSIIAKNFYYGNGKAKKKPWEAYGREDGDAYLTLYASPGEGGLKLLYESLSVAGTDFSVYKKRTGTADKQYLTVTKAVFEEKKLIEAWTPGTTWYYDYADVLTIEATGANNEFDWHTNLSETLIFESTDPHYYDVVAWKKRLWGYQNNVMFGTVQDIFDNNGVVDWNTGDNTYTEAISQPLWQGADITGIAALMSGLVYFKEDNITVVTGNYPAVMSSDTIPCRGLPAENRRSVAVGNEAVYYLGRNGVMRFDGGIPRCISQEAKITGTDAVGFSDGAKYYLSLKEADDKYALYVYDITYGLWHKEDCDGAASFVMLNGELYMAEGNEIYNVHAPQEDVPWECEFWYDEGTHQRKKYKQIDIRGDVGEDCELWLKADDGEWRLIGSPYKGSIKLIPFDCVELSLKLKGKGRCEIKSIDRTFEIVE